MKSPTSCVARTFQVHDKGMSRRRTGVIRTRMYGTHIERRSGLGVGVFRGLLGNVSFQEERKSDSGIPEVK